MRTGSFGFIHGLIRGFKQSDGIFARHWQHWEAGKYSVPDDVAEKMNALTDRKMSMIETC
ncbi:Aca2/YdiL-like domain-containing protein, partial [Nitrosomonas communis]|uniref:Aca2/YdiL-like domain-containing protein n=1 Tax=Nitrosomonas communis TaxID=44574 RepID=UPI0011604EC9